MTGKPSTTTSSQKDTSLQRAGKNRPLFVSEDEYYEVFLKQEAYRAMLYHSDCDNGFIEVINRKPVINVSDTFHAASADCEAIEVDDMVFISELFNKFGYPGVIAWVSWKRDWAQPLRSSQAFHQAVVFIKERLEK